MLKLSSKNIVRKLENGEVMPASVAAMGTIGARALCDKVSSNPLASGIVDGALLVIGGTITLASKGRIFPSLGVGILSGLGWSMLTRDKKHDHWQ